MIDFSLLQLGLSIAVLGISVVFLSLIVLFFCMKIFIRLLDPARKKKKAEAGALEISGRTGKEPITGEVIAAISMAIQRSRDEFHDLEQTIITLNRIRKPYSPWSSKIHGIRRPSR